MFTLGANPTSLNALQAALNTAIGGTSTVTSQAVLTSLQQSGSLTDLRHLSDLTRPENLTRIAGNPVLFQTVSQALKLPVELERQVFQETPTQGNAPSSMTGNTPAASANYRPTSCAMDWEGADLPDGVADGVDTSVQRTAPETAHMIFSDIRKYQGVLRIGPLEEHIRAYAEHLDLRQGVQIYRQTPTACNKKLHELLNMAYLISKLMDDGDPQGEYRDTLHRCNSRRIIVDYLERAREEGPAEAVTMLEKSLALYDEVFGGSINLDILKTRMSPSVTEALNWPKEVTLDNLGAFAVSVRQAFESLGAELATEQRYQLMRLAIALDGAAFGLAAFREEEAGTQAQAMKLAALIEVLYGTGFGDERWLAVADRLKTVCASWANLGPDGGAEELARYGVLASHMLNESKTSYHSLFDALVRRHGKDWGLGEEDSRSFTRNLYRTGALFPLGQHLSALHAGQGNHNRAEQILDRLHRDRKSDRPYAPVFLGEGTKDDQLDMGNKGKGLNELIKMGEEVPSGFALPPVLLSRGDLTPAHLETIGRAIDELERRTGKSFEDGTLKVSVRSGASVSMPGTLLTVIKVGSRKEAVEAIRTVYGSWDNPAAQLYRRYNGVPEDFGTSAIVQEWIETNDHDASGFGLATSDGLMSEPLTRYGRRAHGIDLVSGKHPGEDPMEDPVRDELNRKIARYEDHFRQPVEVEYAVERGKIWMLQIRRAQLNYEDEIRWAVRMIRGGRMTREAGIEFLGGGERLAAALNEPRLLLTGGDRPIAAEAKGGGHPLVGAVTFDEAGIVALQTQGLQAIFVTDNADAGKSAAYAFEAGAAIFNEGNGVSHLEGDLRASNKPHLGGLPVRVDRQLRTAVIGGVPVREGDVLTLDPQRGAIYRGAIPIQEGDSPVASLIRWLLQ